MLAESTPPPALWWALQEVLPATAMGYCILSYKVWRFGGVGTEATDPSLIGQSLLRSDELRQAWTDHVAATFDDDAQAEDRAKRAGGAAAGHLPPNQRSGQEKESP